MFCHAYTSLISKRIENYVCTACLLLTLTGAAEAQKVYNCHTDTYLYALETVTTATDTGIAKLLSAYKDSIHIKMEEVIADNKTPLSKTQPESTLGNWISDAAKKQVSHLGIQADICLFSYACIGKEYLAPGPIKRKDLYDLIPFDNKMVVILLSGTELHYLCDSIVRANGLPVSGLSFTIDSGRATQIRVGQLALNDNRVYSVLVNDYLLSRYSELLSRARYKNRNTGLLLRNLLTMECTELQRKGVPVHAVLEKRIAYAE